MPMPMAPCAAQIVLLVGVAVSLRSRHRRGPSGETFSGRPCQTIGAVGQVSELYTFGAPGAATPGLRNPGSSSGCFPGLRVVAAYKETWYLRQQIDPIPLITEPFGFEHTLMKQAKLYVDGADSRDNITDMKWAECGQTWPDPQNQVVNALLHRRGGIYVERGAKFALGNVVRASIQIALNVTSNSNQQKVADSVRNYGWRLVDSAAVQDEITFVRDSISHLLQDPVTKSCMLTFRGSKSVEDWIHNVQIVKVPFCGLTQEGEECKEGTSRCQTRGGGSFVHKGFRDHVRKVVSSSEWQTKIRPHLSGCAEVIAVGHSLGGAAAGLFSACAAKAPKKGEFGFVDDYEHIGWTVGQPRQLPVWTPVEA